MGYSVGRWDDDTLVVESAGFNDKTWLDFAGHPHSEQLRVIERFTRRDFGHLQLQLTIDDPKTYTRPFTVPVELRLVPDTELLEAVCNENERDTARLTQTKITPIKVSPDALSKFVGTYDVVARGTIAIQSLEGRSFVVTVTGDQLMLKNPGNRISVPMVAVSANHFIQVGSGADVEFVQGAQGSVRELIFHIAEGDTRAVRATK
jgi:hypothetical protein